VRRAACGEDHQGAGRPRPRGSGAPTAPASARPGA
jgi:hypothetical protein